MLGVAVGARVFEEGVREEENTTRAAGFNLLCLCLCRISEHTCALRMCARDVFIYNVKCVVGGGGPRVEMLEDRAECTQHQRVCCVTRRAVTQSSRFLLFHLALCGSACVCVQRITSHYF